MTDTRAELRVFCPSCPLQTAQPRPAPGTHSASSPLVSAQNRRLHPPKIEAHVILSPWDGGGGQGKGLHGATSCPSGHTWFHHFTLEWLSILFQPDGGPSWVWLRPFSLAPTQDNARPGTGGLYVPRCPNSLWPGHQETWVWPCLPTTTPTSPLPPRALLSLL